MNKQPNDHESRSAIITRASHLTIDKLLETVPEESPNMALDTLVVVAYQLLSAGGTLPLQDAIQRLATFNQGVMISFQANALKNQNSTIN